MDNYQIRVGETIDTGKKLFDADGEPRIVYRKRLALTVALPNNTNQDKAHGVTDIDLSMPVVVTQLTGITTAGTSRFAGGNVSFTVSATNINIATTLNLSTFTTGEIEFEFCREGK